MKTQSFFVFILLLGLSSASVVPFAAPNIKLVSLKQVDVDNNIACGVTPQDDIWCTDDAENPLSYKWFKIQGKLKHVSISNGKLYGVNSNDDIFFTNNYRYPNWKQVNGKLKQVDMNGNFLCGVNSADIIFCADNSLDNPQWVSVQGRLKYVSVNNRKLYGANSADNIWFAESHLVPNWKQATGALKQVSFDKNIVCGANASDDIYCADNDLTNPKWFHIPNKSKHVSISNGVLYSVNSQNQVSYTKNIRDPKWTNIYIQTTA